MLTSKNKIIIYADKEFAGPKAKTALGYLRYGECEVVGIVDSLYSGKTSRDIYNDLKPVSIFSTVEEAKKNNPSADVMLIGVAPAGGKFPSGWIEAIKSAVLCKLNIVNGLHEFLSDIPEIKSLAEKENVYLWDVRKPAKNYPIASAKLLDIKNEIILTVGTDAAIGKMTVALELTKEAKKKNIKAEFIATGQTGIMISGNGVPLDAITGDFMAGAIEEEIIRVANKTSGKEILFIEGQGSILHPGWSGVTLALLHGSLPHKMILCHKAKREYLKDTKVKIESLNQFIKTYEDFSLPLRKAKVVGIGINSYGLEKKEAEYEIKKAEDETGLLADDIFLNGGSKLLQACLA